MTAQEPCSVASSGSMPSYLDAQVTAGNHISRKPVRANTIRRVPAPIDIPSSPPLDATEQFTSEDMNTTPRASHMDYEYQNARNPKLFQSNYRFTRHSSNPFHPFQLLPTIVKPARSFAFQLEPLVEEIPGVLYRACGDFTEPHNTIVYRARPHTYREISATELGAAYANATSMAEPLTVRAMPQEIEPDWRDKDCSAQAFTYDKYDTSGVYEEEVEQFVDAHEILVDAVRDRDVSYASCYLDAVEEQVEEEDATGWAEQYTHAVSDVVMSCDLPQEPVYVRTPVGPHDRPVSQHVNNRYREPKQHAHTSSGDVEVRNMIEVRSPGMAGKIIEVARLNGYRG